MSHKYQSGPTEKSGGNFYVFIVVLVSGMALMLPVACDLLTTYAKVKIVESVFK
jgi:hypothetical protein